MTENITAYVSVELDDDLEEGDMVRVDSGAFEDAGLDEASMEEENDDEFDYDRLGFIIDVNTSNFNWKSNDGDESVSVEVDDEAVYVVGMAATEAGAHPFLASDLEAVDRDDVLGDLDIDADPGDAEEQMRAGSPNASQTRSPAVAELQEVGDITGITRNERGLNPWPESWRESDKPARLIAMDAWISMGASFTGCNRSLDDEVSDPEGLCAAWKDQLYGHTYWRSGG